MKERPILFSGPMVRAILEGRKTQTRRVIQKQPRAKFNSGAWYADRYNGGPLWCMWGSKFTPDFNKVGDELGRCPYGEPGDRLWVRESFQPLYGPEAGATKPNWKTGYGYQVSYPATEGVREYHDEDRGLTSRCKPSIHMPRWASRINLEITNVRVERLHDISGTDALAEGIRGLGRDPEQQTYEAARKRAIEETEASARVVFRNLWDAINGDRGFGWEKNPWVWVIEFKRLEATA